ncbi:MAG: M15 family metallopeptidase [Rhodanobacteraceae bacterium]|nr:M15 family metallopeptidase [Rhodanobacteraceae bacterium]
MDSSLDSLTPDTRALAEALLEQATAEGYTLRVVSTRRTCAEQNDLYAQGRTKPGAVITKARGCVSWHVLGRAFDVAITSPKHATAADWQRVGEIGRALGLRWGGDFKGFPDMPHFEYHPGQTIEQACPDPDDCEAVFERTWGGSSNGSDDNDEESEQPTATWKKAAAVGVGLGLVAAIGFAVAG